MPFELNNKNLINTTTQLTIPDNTATAAFLFENSLGFQYSTLFYDDDATTASLTISFDSTQTIDRIALVDHNLKSYTIFYDGVTANTFAMTSTADTTTTDYAMNSETSQYFRVMSVDCTSVTIDMKSTMVADKNKILGDMVLTDNITTFSNRVPSAKQYTPILRMKSFVHQMVDGRYREQILEDNWAVTFSYSFIEESLRDDLESVFTDKDIMIFCPFGTSSGWDSILFPCSWSGSFDFYQYGDNAICAGFSGKISLVESPNGD